MRKKRRKSRVKWCKKITGSDLTKKRGALSAAVDFLEAATGPQKAVDSKEKQFKFTDDQIKSIADKVTDTLLWPSNSLENTMLVARIMSSLEKIAPAKLSLLKQIQSEINKNMPPEMKMMQREQNLWKPNSTAEEIFADYPKMTEYEKTEANQVLFYKIGEINDDARAKSLIDQITDEKTRSNAVEAYDSAKITRTAKEGKLDEAKNSLEP